MIGFWTAIRDFAARRVESAFMREYYHARKCPNCRVWSHQVGGAKDFRSDPDGRYDYMQCNQCEEWSRWDGTYLMPVLAEPWRCQAIPASI
jgi:hypothetical protein